MIKVIGLCFVALPFLLQLTSIIHFVGDGLNPLEIVLTLFVNLALVFVGGCCLFLFKEDTQ